MKGATIVRKDKNMVEMALLDLEHHPNLRSWPFYDDLPVDDDSEDRCDEVPHQWRFGNDRQTQHHLVSLYAPPCRF